MSRKKKTIISALLVVGCLFNQLWNLRKTVDLLNVIQTDDSPPNALVIETTPNASAPASADTETARPTASTINAAKNISTAHHSSSWMSNLSVGIPVHERGKIYVSLGICCSKEAQKNTQRETRRHGHSNKPYDVAAVLAASLWQMQSKKNNVELSIFIAMGYIKGNEESTRNLHNLQKWLKQIDGDVTAWAYDVSEFSDPFHSCIRAGQIGRYYAHESDLIQDNDFVMTTDSDIFPIDSDALMPFLRETNPDGDYYRVFIRESDHRSRTTPLFGIGQTVWDWKQSLTTVGFPSLRDAINMANTPKENTWGYDQALSTAAIQQGGLCHFPSEASTASKEQDAYTCYKGENTKKECLNSYQREKGCYYSHFTPDGTAQMMRLVYDGIAAGTHQMDLPYKTAEMILGVEQPDDDLKEEHTLENHVDEAVNKKPNNNYVEKTKGPLLFGWNGTTHEEGEVFCQRKAKTVPLYICPYRVYCTEGLPFHEIQSNENEELWSPVASHEQPVWVAVGRINPCLQKGYLDESDKTKIKFILCCYEEEEEQAEIMPDLATVNHRWTDDDDKRCKSKCDENSIIRLSTKRLCLARCRWMYRQKAVARLTNFSEVQNYDSSMTMLSPLMEGRCIDISNKIRYDGVCTSVGHRQKPQINLVLSSRSWLAREINLGLRTCAASQCYVSTGPFHSNSSHLYMGTFQRAAHPAQVEKVTANQINVMIQPESLQNTNSGTPMQPDVNIDWLVSHRQDGFDTMSWIPYSQINTDDHNFRITGKTHGNRRIPIPVFISNCNQKSVHSDRARLISKLGQFIEIEQFGKCDLPNTRKVKLESAYPMCARQPRRSAMWDAQKECVFFHSMFALVAENTFEENYLTEKIYQPLKMGTVLIVMGNSSLYRHHLPDPNAAIFVDDFPNYEAAAQFIHTLVKDSKMWDKHLAWKRRAFSDEFSALSSHSFATLPCDLCDKYSEEVLPDSERSWDQSLDIETLDKCIIDIFSRNTIPDNLPLISPALGFDAVFVTHYTPLKERKKAMIERVHKQFGVIPIFIEDFDREDLTDEDVKCFGDSEAQMAYIQRVSKKGEVSLTMKHFVIYFYLFTHSLDNVLVLEDDAAFMHSDWTSKDSYWQKMIKDLPPDYDLVFLSGFGNMHNRGVKVTDNLYLAQQSRVASMYLISQKGARNMLRSLPMVSVIDFQMNYAANWKDNNWMTQLPGWHGPRTMNIKLYHSEPVMSYQLEPDGTHKKTATWKVE